MLNPIAELEIFYSVVETGSFSAAARRLSRTPSSISKTIAGLEARLGTKLFERLSHTVKLNESGNILYSEGLRVFDALSDAENAVRTQAVINDGVLRVRTIFTFAKYRLAPVVGEFLGQNPGLRLEFILGNDPVDFLNENIDVAILSGSQPDSDLIIRRLFAAKWLICGAPEYFLREGTPSTPEDLLHHNCLNFTHSTHWNDWPWIDPVGQLRLISAKGTVGANQGDMLLELVKHGVGIARLADFHIESDVKSGRIATVLHEYNQAGAEDIYVLHRDRRHLSPQLKVFLSFLDTKFKEPAEFI